MSDATPAHEEAIRRVWESGDRRAAAGETIRRYGPEILALLCALHDDADDAQDAFSDFSERLLGSLDRFAYDCSMRTWAYVLARRASYDVKRASGRRAKRHTALSRADEIGKLVAAVRTQTMTILRTETKSALAKLRDELSPEDRLLLVLRVDRTLPWEDVARIFLEDEPDVSQARLGQEAARLRKRFQLVKERLATLAKERGLIEG